MLSRTKTIAQVITLCLGIALFSISVIAEVVPNPQWIMDSDLELALKTSVQGKAITQINVEVDYMVAPDHTHELLQAEIDALVEMFACQGITLNIEISDPIPHVDVLVRGAGLFFSNFDPVSGFAGIKLANYNHSGESGWHYCIMAHKYDNGAGGSKSANPYRVVGAFFGRGRLFGLFDYDPTISLPLYRNDGA